MKEVHCRIDGNVVTGTIEKVSDKIAEQFIATETSRLVNDIEDLVENGYVGDSETLNRTVNEVNSWIRIASFDLPESAQFHYEVREFGETLYVIRSSGR